MRAGSPPSMAVSSWLSGGHFQRTTRADLRHESRGEVKPGTCADPHNVPSKTARSHPGAPLSGPSDRLWSTASMSSRWLQMRFPQDDGWNAANPSCQQVPDAGASRPLKFHPCQKQRYPARSSCCSVACSEKAPPCRLQCTEYSNSSRSTLARATGGGGLGGMHGAAAADARRQQAGGRLGGRGHARAGFELRPRAAWPQAWPASPRGRGRPTPRCRP